MHNEEPDVLYPELSDRKLLHRCQQGDHRAFEQLYYRYRDRLLKCSWEMTGDHEAAVDAVKETFQELFSTMDSLSDNTPVYLILYRQICRYCRGKEQQKAARKKELEMERDTLAGEEDWTGPTQEVQIDEEIQDAQGVLLDMSKQHRNVFVLRVLENLTREEVAWVLDCSEDDVRERLGRGIEEFRDATGTLLASLSDRLDQEYS